jgi:hypothetical protein
MFGSLHAGRCLRAGGVDGKTDFGQERRYFAMRGNDAVAAYGAPWPGGDVSEMLLRRAHR